MARDGVSEAEARTRDGRPMADCPQGRPSRPRHLDDGSRADTERQVDELTQTTGTEALREAGPHVIVYAL